MGNRVLIVEDEPAMAEIVAEVITDLGYECFTALDGDQGFAVARAEHPDVIVTDFMMPGKSGIELIRALRGEPGLSDVPVILVSAATPRDAGEAWRFLAKPVDTRVLADCLAEACVGRPRQPVRAPLRSEPSSLNVAHDEMLNWVAHEIKSPLSAAMMNAHVIRKTMAQGSSPLRRRADVIIRQLRRMDQLVVSILDAARIEEGRLALNLGRVDLAQLVLQTVEPWREIHPEYSFDVTVPEQATTVEVDSERVRQILDNLLSNAIKYGGPDGSIRVSVARAEVLATVSVRDHGPGMPADQLEKIFDRFHRVDGKSGRGHGLGLYIANALARLHGGSVTAVSSPGNGATFTLTLPLAT